MIKKEIHISVRYLVEQGLRTGDIGFSFTGLTRLQEARRLHQQIQQSRPNHYQAEVPVSYTYETDRFILTIGGRIDGVLHHGTTNPVVEEIKTTTRHDTGSLFPSEADNPLHWGQLKVYAYFYAIQYQLTQIETQLTYIQVDTEQIEEHKAEFSLDALESFFLVLAEKYLDWAGVLIDWQVLRDSSIAGLSFPYSEYRMGQRQMAADVFRAVRDKNQLIIEAATGIGKTMAVIFPVIQQIAEGVISQAFYLTARTTGRLSAENALDELRQQGLKLKSLTLTAKQKICFQADQICDPEQCVYARGFYDRIDEAVRYIFNKDIFSREMLEDTAMKYQVCPFELSLCLLPAADFIICDYNYAFDPKVSLKFYLEAHKNRFAFLVDEAHNLADRSRDMFSADIDRESVHQLLAVIPKQTKPVYAILENIAQVIGGLEREFIKPETRCLKTDPPEALHGILRKFLEAAEQTMAGHPNRKHGNYRMLMDFYFRVHDFLRVWGYYDTTYCVCYIKQFHNFRFRLFCLDPSEHIREALGRAAVSIFFSATLTPAAYFKTLFGCRENAKSVSLLSPFPSENLGVYVCDWISTYFKDRDKTIAEVCRTMLALIRQRTGNYMVYFPAYGYLNKAQEWCQQQGILKELPEGSRIVVQKPNMTEADKTAFLDCFKVDNKAAVIGFAVMGGIFGEGIDLVGERLCGAVIVGVGLPGITPERELIKAYFAKANGSGFEYAYLYPGINRVLQAAGRVIRSEIDRGVIMLIDQRYTSFQYSSLLPGTWRSTVIKHFKALSRQVEHFWKSQTNG